jgi:sulfate adenylyltransferase subunit 1
VTGASTADAVLVLVDVRKGVLEQTRRHLAVAALLRVPHVLVAINKVDLVDFDQAVVVGVAKQVAEVAEDLGLPDVRTVPVSALAGDNIVERSSRTPWYDGPSVLELLEQLPTADDPRAERFRLPVQVVLRPQGAARDPRYVDYRGYAGAIAEGVVRVGDPVVVLPSGRRTTVTGIDTADGELAEAFAPRSVAVRLADDIDIARGDLIAAAEDAPEPTQDVEATICWLGDRDVLPGARVLIKHTTRTVQAIVRDVIGRLDLDDLALKPAERLQLNDIGRVRVRTASPVAAEPYVDHRRTGAFLLVDAHDGATLAAGMVGDPLVARAPGGRDSLYSI